MNQEFMRKVQRSSVSVWSLAARESITLRVGPGARVVHVCEGRLWLTSAGSADEASIDIWLVPGESLELPAGLAVVMEAWPSARFQLLVPPQACRGAGRARSRLAPLAAWVGRQFDRHAEAALQPSGR